MLDRTAQLRDAEDAPELPFAIVKLPKFGIFARAKRNWRDWRRQRQELYLARRDQELQMLKELEHSSETVLGWFRRLLSRSKGDSGDPREGWPGPGG